jgi:hypothetical protein
MAEVSIRAVAETHDEGLRPLREDYNAFHEAVGPTALAKAVTRATWARLFDSDGSIRALVTETADGALHRPRPRPLLPQRHLARCS